MKGVVREAISSMVCANAHLQACLGAAGAGESSSSVERCLLGDQCLVSSGPSACNTASVSSKSYNKLLSLLAGSGLKNLSVVGKHDVRLWDTAIQGVISPAGIYGVLGHMKGGPRAAQASCCRPIRGVSWSCSPCLCRRPVGGAGMGHLSCAAQTSTPNNQAAPKAQWGLSQALPSTHTEVSVLQR